VWAKRVSPHQMPYKIRYLVCDDRILSILSHLESAVSLLTGSGADPAVRRMPAEGRRQRNKGRKPVQIDVNCRSSHKRRGAGASFGCPWGWAMRLLIFALATALLAASATGCAAPSSTLVPNAEQRTVLQAQLAAMRAKIVAHWHPSPVIVSQPDHDKHVVVVRIQLDRDGRLSAPVQVVSTGSGPFYQSAAVALKRAIELSQPFDMFSPSTYDDWKDAEIMFDPGTVTAAPSR
jgi:hypothetical protein